jgi:dihydrofolate synthase/folylpolyglutamate synthase
MERFHALGREWLLDVAHNPAGAEALALSLNTVMRYSKTSILIFSCLHDKPLHDLARILFPKFQKVLLTPIRSLRATPLEEMAAVAESVGARWELTHSVEEVIGRALETKPDVIVVSGSVYLVGEVRKLLEEKEG